MTERPALGAASVVEYTADGPGWPLDVGPYFRTLVERGPDALIENAEADVRALVVGNDTIPLVVCEPRASNSYVVSPLAHYVWYTREEIIKRNTSTWACAFEASFSAVGALLRFCEIDRVVYVNNWLYSTNPSPVLARESQRRLTEYLVDRYPRHAIVQRSVNPTLNPSYGDDLRSIGYRMVRSRRVHVIHTASDHFRKRTNVKLDRRALRDSPYEIIDGARITEGDLPRLVELYRALYLDKHSRINPQLAEGFFRATLADGSLCYRAWRRDGRIDAFASFYVQGGVVTGVAVGYDTAQPADLALYRQIIAKLIEEALERGATLNLSSGASEFKALRGALERIEYDAVFDSHLSARRRLAWRLVALQGRLWRELRGVRRP